MSVVRSTLDSELIDRLTEAVVLPGDPQLRADRVYAIVEAVVEAVGWRAGEDAASGELQSVSGLLEAAWAHRSRIRDSSSALAGTAPSLLV